MAPDSPPDDPSQTYGDGATRRYEVNQVLVLKLHLEDWEKEKTQGLGMVESYRGRCNTAKTELYQLMGFYSVFQGVIFTAVAQTSKLTCQLSFFPAVLSGLASIATAFSVHYKLEYYETQKSKLLDTQNEVSGIIDKIQMLKANGKNFKFASIVKKKANSDAKTKSKRRLVWWAVMLFLVIFSGFILASCIIVLCWDPDQHKLKGCASNLCWSENGNSTTAGG